MLNLFMEYCVVVKNKVDIYNCYEKMFKIYNVCGGIVEMDSILRCM